MTYIPIQEALRIGNEERRRQTLLLRKMEKHLSVMTDLELKEEDLDDGD